MMKRITTYLFCLFVCCGCLTAQSDIDTEAFSFSYDAKVWEPVSTEDIFLPEGFYYRAIQRKDGEGAIFVMSSVEDKDLVTYAATTLQSNSLYAQGHTDLEESSVKGRKALQADFKYGENLGRAWFFKEGGRLLTFSILDKKDIQRGVPVLHGLEIYPAPLLEQDGISEAELISTFRKYSDNLKLLTDDAAAPAIRMTALNIDPDQKTLVCTFTTTLVSEIKQLLPDKAALFEPSPYERRALELGYTLTWIYREPSGKEIGRVSYTKEDLGLLE